MLLACRLMFRARVLREYLEVVSIAWNVMEGERLKERLTLRKVGSCTAPQGTHRMPLSGVL